MNASTVSNLKDVLLLKNKPEEISEKDLDKMNRMTSSDLYLTQDLKYYMIFCEEDLGDPKSQVLEREH